MDKFFLVKTADGSIVIHAELPVLIFKVIHNSDKTIDLRLEHVVSKNDKTAQELAAIMREMGEWYKTNL